ncbi:helix-turn-helix domain-containing protein [Leclercia sp. AS011]|uniref:helix-turn-helix domain-containing protein n=1 Tax=Leclercia sp. AS011 TaxID=3081257 RepID=UPI00301598F6
MTVQLIKDEEGKAQYAVIPYSEYFRMRLAMLEYDDDDDDESDWEDIPYESDIYDNVGLPGEVCNLMHSENVSLQAAWRIHRGLSQQDVADKLGISQSAVSQLEAVDSRPQKRTREKLAAIYGCKQEQISLYLPKEG